MLQRIWLSKLKVYHLIEDGPLVVDGIVSVRNKDHLFYRPMIELMPDGWTWPDERWTWPDESEAAEDDD